LVNATSREKGKLQAKSKRRGEIHLNVERPVGGTENVTCWQGLKKTHRQSAEKTETPVTKVRLGGKKWFGNSTVRISDPPYQIGDEVPHGGLTR